MKKVLLAALMVYGLSLASCDKGSEAVPEGKLVDVVFTSSSVDADSRTIVTASGVTRWAVGDVVKVVDVDQTPRIFTYQGSTTSSSGQFKGQLMGGKGTIPYYAYYGSEAIPCPSGNLYCLEIDYTDLNLLDPTATVYGLYCPMVAIPIKFDADQPLTTGFEFHHITSLIEASISCTGKGSIFDNVNFDQVVFEVKSDEGALFNSNINMDMTKIKGKPEVDIAYSEATSGKLSTLTTTLRYSSVQNLSMRIDNSETKCFSIPIYALPMTAKVPCYETVTFSNNGMVTCVLSLKKGFDGLKPSGLNVLNFNEDQIVE